MTWPEKWATLREDVKSEMYSTLMEVVNSNLNSSWRSKPNLDERDLHMVVLKWTTSIQFCLFIAGQWWWWCLFCFCRLLPGKCQELKAGRAVFPHKCNVWSNFCPILHPSEKLAKCSQSAIALSTRCNYAPTIFISICSSYLLPHHLNYYWIRTTSILIYIYPQ